MDKKNIDFLKEAFPLAFGPTVFDEDLGDGWFMLILDVAQQVEPRASKYYISNVKQKFGGLRIDVENRNPDWVSLPLIIIDAVNRAELASLSVCEYCGSKDVVKTRTTTNRLIFKTLCESCSPKKNNA